MPLAPSLSSATLARVVALWTSILLTMPTFHHISRPAGWLFAPYLAWVTFAATLHFALWCLNPA